MGNQNIRKTNKHDTCFLRKGVGFFSFHETLGPFIKKTNLKPLGHTSALPICCYLTHLAGSRAGFLEDHESWFIPGRKDRVIFQVILISHVEHHWQQTPSCQTGAAGVACPSTSLSMCFHSCFSDQRRIVLFLERQNRFILCLCSTCIRGL